MTQIRNNDMSMCTRGMGGVRFVLESTGKCSSDSLVAMELRRRPMKHNKHITTVQSPSKQNCVEDDHRRRQIACVREDHVDVLTCEVQIDCREEPEALGATR
jgi:hypothetical protein